MPLNLEQFKTITDKLKAALWCCLPAVDCHGEVGMWLMLFTCCGLPWWSGNVIDVVYLLWVAMMKLFTCCGLPWWSGNVIGSDSSGISAPVVTSYPRNSTVCNQYLKIIISFQQVMLVQYCVTLRQHVISLWLEILHFDWLINWLGNLL